MRLSILVRNEDKLLWSSANNIILIIYPIKFIFSCLFHSGWIDSGTNRFGFNSVRVISGSGLYWINESSVGSGSVRFISDYGSNRVNKISVRFGFGSGHIGFRVNSGCYSFGSVRFWVGSISGWNRFNLFSCRFGFDFGSFGSGHSDRVTFARSTRNLLGTFSVRKFVRLLRIEMSNKLDIHWSK